MQCSSSPYLRPTSSPPHCVSLRQKRRIGGLEERTVTDLPVRCPLPVVLVSSYPPFTCPHSPHTHQSPCSAPCPSPPRALPGTLPTDADTSTLLPPLTAQTRRASRAPHRRPRPGRGRPSRRAPPLGARHGEAEQGTGRRRGECGSNLGQASRCRRVRHRRNSS